jgi:hypothetical protein
MGIGSKQIILLCFCRNAFEVIQDAWKTVKSSAIKKERLNKTE